MDEKKQTYSRSYEALMRLKTSEKRKPTDANVVKKYELRVDSENNLVELKTVYENQAESALSKLEALERKMSGGDNYLTFYNEKKALEDKLLGILSAIEKERASISMPLLKKMQYKRDIIERNRKNFK